jgi:muramoyltetrapeptide carboxypeptidase
LADYTPVLKPKALLPGARILAAAPASSARPERIDAGIANLRLRGFDVQPGPNAYRKQPPYFSAPVEDRLREITDAFLSPEVDAIFSIRGGYGSNYLLPSLPLESLRGHPKVFFGYSDTTALQTYLLDQLGLVAFHGPLVAGDFDREDGVDEASFTAATRGGLVQAGPEHGLRALRAKPGQGSVRGTLYGGCLSILTSVLGTPYAPRTEGKLLFLEDVEERPYRIDRMLRQMMLAGKFAGVRGFIFGEMLGCASPNTEPDLVERVILDVLSGFDVPIAFGLRSGHVSRGNVTLPFGIEAELRLDGTPTLQYLEPAVIS